MAYGSSDHGSRTSRFVAAVVVCAAAFGVRALWTEDMEYKSDERFMFERSQRVGIDEPWPEFGMTSGVGLRNPGMSIWVFAALARVTGAVTPLSLTHAVIAMNLLAFAVLASIALQRPATPERVTWLWALAIAAVSPLAVLAQRKIWAQSALPLFTALFLWGWWRRDRPWGALLWGSLSAVLGQVHMSGFLFAGAFVVWELAFGGGPRPDRPRTRWLPATIGASLGLVPLVPWARYVAGSPEVQRAWSLGNATQLRAFRYWISDALGLGLDYSLGPHYFEFMRWSPLEPASEFYPVLYLHAAAFALGAVVIARAFGRAWRAPHRWNTPRALVHAIRASSNTAFTVTAAFCGYGVLLTASGVDVWRHYMYVTFPLEWVFFAALTRWALPARSATRVLLLACAVQLALSLAFLAYIHEHGGAPHGDYGRAFSAQGRQ